MAAGRTTTKQRTATAARAAATVVAPAASPINDPDPQYGRAILKIALELKKPTAKSYEAVVEQTIRSMRLDPDKFRHYLGANRAERMGLLLAAARKVAP
jgi:hypothetical protein